MRKLWRVFALVAALLLTVGGLAACADKKGEVSVIFWVLAGILIKLA